MKIFRDFREFESVLQSVELNVLVEKAMQLLRSSLHEVSTEDRQALLAWVRTVQKISQSPNLTAEEKEHHIEALESSHVVSQFFKSVSESLIEKIPVQEKGLLKAGLAGLGMFTSATRPQFALLGWFAFQKLLPKFLLMAQGAQFLAAAQSVLDEPGIEMR